MNSRERFLATMRGELVERVPLWEFGYWSQTLNRWYQEGLPHRVGHTGEMYEGSIFGEALIWDPAVGARDQDVHMELGLDEGIQRVPINSFVSPPFERKLIDDEGDTVVEQDPRGHIVRNMKDRSSMPQIIKTLVETREDWEQVKAERLQPTLTNRLPEDWEAERKRLQYRNFPLCIGGIAAQCGFYHTARYLLGAERLLYSFYDQAALVKDMMNYLADFWSSLYDQMLSQVDVDFAYWTEDIGFKTGPFIGPDTFREFLMEPYKKLTGTLRDHGVRIILVDSDGDVRKLLPEFLKGGVTGMGPMEAAASMDVWEIRQTYPRLQILGGVDKRTLAAGKEAIRRELNHKIARTLPTGRYIPHIDHLVPPDVSWENFVFYRKRLEQLIIENRMDVK
ncbi:MAG: uroporphyrinogen decarboxylase family protein [Anaerolineales bacterium]